jgi:glutathione S-transferase
MSAFPLTALVTIATLFVYIWVTLQIGKARRLHSISAPDMTGPDDFNRVIRVHGNTMEAMLLFLPSLWLFAAFNSDLYAGIIGLFFPLGRIIYARGYYQAADKRGRGFMIGFLSTVVLLVGALIAVAQNLLSAYSM